MTSFPRQPDLTAFQQAVRVQARFPQFRVIRTRRELEMLGWLQPRLMSPRYEIRIVKAPRRVPDFFVESPPIAAGAPHLYKEGNLCLFWPEEWRWADNVNIATTLLPWAAVWLLYYELWTESDKWLGPSSPHSNPKSQSA